ncbi:MFS transporter [Actinotalea solisilvae]|uniref:MFS transporter n=1 Tax=Actinotalea solisilvae TaxID=2072922 RepID=UPI0018F17584|nr:MFS transporter [Actinotalea solisilvae]
MPALPRAPRPPRTAPARRPPARDAHLAPEVLRARTLLIGLYALLGLTVSSWLARLPTVRSALDLGTAELGTILLVGAVGSLATVLVAGGVVARWGSRRTLLTAAVMFSVANLLLGLAPTVGEVGVLVVGVLLLSSSFALGNVPMNVETVVIERRMGRTVVPQFHAAFSLGSVTGSALGALASWADVPLLVQFGLVSVGTLVWRFAAVPGAVLPAEPSPVAAADLHDAPPARRGAGLRAALSAWRERRTLLIGVVVMAAALSEGTANNWLAISVVDGFGQPEAVAALVFGTFVASMTAARLAGTYLIDRFGRVAVLTASGVTSLAGLVLFGLAPSLPTSVVGVVAWGLGAGLVVPIGMAAVSGDPLRAAGRVAVVSAFASVASITAPPLIGLAAEAMGARHALLLITGVMLAGTLLSGSVREPGGARAPRRGTVGRDAVAPAPALSATPELSEALP